LLCQAQVLKTRLKMAKGTRAWCFTLNNYTEEERDALRSLKCKYIVFGYERGEEGTPHLQGYVHLSTQKTLSAMKKFIPRAHLEPRRGTIDEAVDYCKKDGDFEEYGEKPKTQQEKGVSEKARWKRIFEKAEEGDEEWLKENEPNVAFKHMATFRSHKKPKTEVMDYEETPHEWWYGPTGTGKSRKVWSEYPGHYPKEKNKWWCNYVGQDTVVIEEADRRTWNTWPTGLRCGLIGIRSQERSREEESKGSDHSRSLSPVTIHQRNVSRVQATWNQSLDGSRWYALDLSYLISLRDLIYKRKPSATTNDSLVYDEASEAVRGSGRPRRLPPNIPNFPAKTKISQSEICNNSSRGGSG